MQGCQRNANIAERLHALVNCSVKEAKCQQIFRSLSLCYLLLKGLGFQQIQQYDTLSRLFFNSQTVFFILMFKLLKFVQNVLQFLAKAAVFNPTIIS